MPGDPFPRPSAGVRCGGAGGDPEAAPRKHAVAVGTTRWLPGREPEGPYCSFHGFDVVGQGRRPSPLEHVAGAPPLLEMNVHQLILGARGGCGRRYGQRRRAGRRPLPRRCVQYAGAATGRMCPAPRAVMCGRDVPPAAAAMTSGNTGTYCRGDRCAVSTVKPATRPQGAPGPCNQFVS